MLGTIMTVCGWAALLFLAVVIISFICMFKALKSENAAMKAKVMPATIVGFGGLFLTGGAWIICWLISLFV